MLYEEFCVGFYLSLLSVVHALCLYREVFVFKNVFDIFLHHISISPHSSVCYATCSFLFITDYDALLLVMDGSVSFHLPLYYCYYYKVFYVFVYTYIYIDSLANIFRLLRLFLYEKV